MKKIFNALSVLCFIYCLSYLLFRYQEISRIASSASLKILFLPAYSFLVGSGAMLFSPLLGGRRQLMFRHLAYAVAFFAAIYLIDYVPVFYACHCISLAERMEGIRHSYMCLVSLSWIVLCCLSMGDGSSGMEVEVSDSK